MSHLLGCPKNSNPYAECECERQSRLNLQNELERNTEALNSHRSTLEQDNAALRACCERLEGALTRCTTSADTFRAQHWPRICALIAKDNKCAIADIAYPVCLSSIGQLARAALAQLKEGAP